jgi:hypothetical protein
MKKNLLTTLIYTVALFAGIHTIHAQCSVPPTITVTTTNTPCNASKGIAIANATGGTPPYTFSWNDGTSSAKDSGMAAGVYQVTVYDSNNCSSTATATISDSSGPSVVVNVTNVKCFGDTNGAINLTVTGVKPYSCYWSQVGAPVTTQYLCPGGIININASMPNITAGTYVCAVRDGNGCITTTPNIVVSQPAALSISPVTTNASCATANGSASVTVSGGVTPYSYSWNGGAASTTSSMNNISAGYYNVVVTDNNGCKDSVAAIVNSTNGPVPYVTATTPFNCVLGTMGSVTMSDSNGTGPYLFSWSNGSTGQTLTGVTGGTYYVTIDNGGCIGVAAVTVPQALPAGVSVCMVTVDTIQKTTVMWNKTTESHIMSYNLYRKPSSGTTYQLRERFCAGYSTIFTDSVSNTATSGYDYEVSEVDSCGNESPLSTPINSIYVTATDNGSNVVLNWAAYQGTFGSYYYIYRDTVQNVFALYDSVASNVLTYTDTKPLITSNPVYYTIGVSNITGCNPTQIIEHGKGGPGAYTSAKSNTKKLVHGGPTSLNSLNEHYNITIYPNPSNGVFTIQSSGISRQTLVEVYNMIGEKVYSNSLNIQHSKFNIDLSDQSAGVYMYKILSEKGEYLASGKLIILR